MWRRLASRSAEGMILDPLHLTMLPNPECDERPIFDIFSAHMQTRIVEIAVRIGFFEALQSPQSLGTVANKIFIGLRATKIITAVLRSLGLVATRNDQIELTEISREYLLQCSPFYKGEFFRLISQEEMELLRKVHLQDNTARPTTTQWLAGRVIDPAAQGSGMHTHAFAAACAFAKNPCFSKIRNLLDVGGGVGSTSIALALHYPEIRCTVMDLAGMRDEGQKMVDKFGVSTRVSILSVDMFRGHWPKGFDGIIFSNIFHNWRYERCLKLARKAFDALEREGRVFVMEMLLNEANGRALGPALFSAMMLLKMEGSQMLAGEISHLLSNAGFVETVVLADFGYYSLLQARKAPQET